MFDPQAECPQCNARLGSRKDCGECGWRPGPPAVRPVDKTPAWTPPADPEPLTEEQRAALRQALDGLYAKFGVPVEKLRKFTLAGVATRCSQCANGKFVHGGVRYCAACYGKL